MPRFRADLASLQRYEAGRDMDAVMREFGLDTIIKLASNESPYPPFEPVIEAMAAKARDVNRYPDNDYHHLRMAIAEHLGVGIEEVWVGAGSSELLRMIALAVGGPGTSALFAWPSFAIYPIASQVAAAEQVRVPLDETATHDLDAMASAVRSDTTVVYVCNPNNPTGTVRSGDDVEAFIRALDPSVLVVVDEAYAEFVTDPGYRTMIPLARSLPNVVVTRTFSKVYGLAGERVGYAIAQPGTIGGLEKPQAPFVVTGIGEAAAIEALRHQDLVAARASDNAEQRRRLERGLEALGVPFVPSQANFVYTGPWADGRAVVERLIRRGVITRPIGASHIRVSVGSAEEIDAVLDALAHVVGRAEAGA